MTHLLLLLPHDDEDGSGIHLGWLTGKNGTDLVEEYF